jgi:hypothetical protein
MQPLSLNFSQVFHVYIYDRNIHTTKSEKSSNLYENEVKDSFFTRGISKHNSFLKEFVILYDCL